MDVSFLSDAFPLGKVYPVPVFSGKKTKLGPVFWKRIYVLESLSFITRSTQQNDLKKNTVY